MKEKKPAYFRARIALISELLDSIPDTGEKNNNHVLLRNGMLPVELLHGKTEEAAVQHRMETGHFSNTPLSFSELCRWDTWFARHPEKVAGIEVVTTSLEFPITIKGTSSDIIKVLTPDSLKNDSARLKRIRIVNAKAKAKLKLLELMKT